MCEYGEMMCDVQMDYNFWNDSETMHAQKFKVTASAIDVTLDKSTDELKQELLSTLLTGIETRLVNFVREEKKPGRKLITLDDKKSIYPFLLNMQGRVSFVSTNVYANTPPEKEIMSKVHLTKSLLHFFTKMFDTLRETFPKMTHTFDLYVEAFLSRHLMNEDDVQVVKIPMTVKE